MYIHLFFSSFSFLMYETIGFAGVKICQLALELMVLGGLEEVHFLIFPKVPEMTFM